MTDDDTTDGGGFILASWPRGTSSSSEEEDILPRSRAVQWMAGLAGGGGVSYWRLCNVPMADCHMKK